MNPKITNIKVKVILEITNVELEQRLYDTSYINLTTRVEGEVSDEVGAYRIVDTFFNEINKKRSK